MKKVSSETVRKRNLRALLLGAVALAAVAVLFSLPVIRFSTCLFTKKSGNTFVGDERYVAARAEADAAAEEYSARQGLGSITVDEEVIQRVNSRGKPRRWWCLRSMPQRSAAGPAPRPAEACRREAPRP